MNGCLDEEIDIWWTDELTDGEMDGWMDGWIDGLMDGWVVGKRSPLYLEPPLNLKPPTCLSNSTADVQCISDNGKPEFGNTDVSRHGFNGVGPTEVALNSKSHLSPKICIGFDGERIGRQSYAADLKFSTALYLDASILYRFIHAT